MQISKIAVIGDNVTNYSLSPRIHNFWLKKYKVPFEYLAIDIPKEGLKERLSDLKGELFAFNVTTPHKEDIIKFLDKSDKNVDKVGACNLVVSKDSMLEGYNTDIYGFVTTLKKYFSNMYIPKVLILGSGGVTKSVTSSLFGFFNKKKIFIATRSKEKKISNEVVEYIDYININDYLKDVDLVINSTPRNSKLLFSPDKNITNILFFDLNYNSAELDFLRIAKNCTARVCDGLDMLLFQAQETFRICFDITPDIHEIKQSLI